MIIKQLCEYLPENPDNLEFGFSNYIKEIDELNNCIVIFINIQV